LRIFKRSRDDEPEVLAAVDLGSNSFHMIVARLSHGQLTVIDRLREMVRLAAGIDTNDRLDDASQQKALECLARFGERIRDMRAEKVRVVGTSTLRRVGRNSAFIEDAEDALGHPVEIISGVEEARLIYQGVYHSAPGVDGAQVVIDIGGGSTEIISGSGRDAEDMESLKLGCVGVSRTYFGGGKLSKRRFDSARLATQLKLQPMRRRFLRRDPVRLIGASGTIRAAQSVLSALAGEPTAITVNGLRELIERCTQAGHVDRLDLPSLSDQRRPVFPGGVAILLELLVALEFDEMSVSDGALKEGLLYDMIGRMTDEDARERTVRSMEGRFNVDREQAGRVEATALALLEQVAPTWKLAREEDRLMLRWAARLHEVGLDIAHSGYQKHGAYLLEFSDMPGFPTDEQQVLARIVAGHRGKLGRNGDYDELPKAWRRSAKRLTILLRLAVLLNRSRTGDSAEDVSLDATGRHIVLALPRERPGSGPLTWADLEREIAYLADADLEMTLAEAS